jgi:hypothetical protein
MTARAALNSEINAYRALWLCMRGRNFAIEPGAVPIGSSRGLFVMPAAFAIATAIEIAVLHLLVPWLWLQVTLAVVSIWSLVALFGHLAIHRTNPHYLTHSSLVLRQSGTVVTSIERTNILSIVPRRRFSETAPTIIDGRLYLPNTEGTTVDLVLESPISATVPALFPSRRKTEQIHQISLYVDEPTRLISIVAGCR